MLNEQATAGPEYPIKRVTGLQVDVTKLHDDAVIPKYATPGAAGVDLSARLDEPVLLPSYARALIPTGLSIAVPEGYEMQIRPRSGWAFTYGLTVLNTPGTVDSDYRGEVKVLLVNFGDKIVIEPGMRIAQAVLSPIERVMFREVQELAGTKRGAGGFGSTN